MTVLTVNNAPCEINVSLKEHTLEASIVGDWVLDAQTPDLDAVLAQMGDGTDIKQLVFSTEALGRWDSLLMTELIRLIDYGAKQGIQVETATLPEGMAPSRWWFHRPFGSGRHRRKWMSARRKRR